MFFKMFVDETGTDCPPIYGMAGYLARAENWALFNDEWDDVLRESPSIEAFHMTEARYYGHDKKLPRLMDVIKKHVCAAFTVGVLHEDFDSIVKGRVSKLYNTPYAMLYGLMITCVSHYMETFFPGEKVDFIFDEKGRESDRLQSMHSDAVKSYPDTIKRTVENRPLHLKDNLTPPLQAADILAWVYRRIPYLISCNKPIDPILNEILALVPLNSFGRNRADLERLVAHLTKLGRETGNYVDHDLKWLIENQDFIITNINRRAIAEAKVGWPVEVMSFDARQMKRFLLVRSCPSCNSPHLHRRAGGECLAVT